MATQSSDYNFASAQAATIAAGVGILQLQDRDHSFWQRAGAEPGHAGKFRSQDRFLPSGSTDNGNGGWWELMSDQIITPAMFGCSLSISDNSAGLTNFYTYLETFECVANHAGRFPVQNTITMGTATTNEDSAENNCSTIHGRIELLVSAPIAGAVLRNRMKRGTKIEGVSISPDAATGGESLVYANKVFDIGLLIEGGAQMQTIDFVAVGYAKICGVLVNGISPNNVFANRFGTGYIYGCGSGLQNDGVPAATDANFLTTAYSAYLRRGSSVGNDFDLYQSTEFSVTAVPPQIVSDRGLVSFVRVGNEEYPVESIDRTPGALKVVVWGWVPTSVAASGTIRYVFGGGLHSVGGDAGIQIGSMAITACAIGNHNGALYPGHFDLTLQHNYIGQVVGTSPANATVGGTTRGYFEGNTTDLWFLTNLTRDYSYRLFADQALSLLRVKFHSSKRTPDSAKFRSKPQGLYLSYRNRFHGFVQEPDFEGQYNSHVCSFQIEPRVTALRASAAGTEWIAANTCIIRVENWDQGTDGGTTPADFTRLFGYRSQYYLCTGPNANGAPGTVLILRGNNTINGVASDLAISDLTGPGFLLIERDPNNESNLLVQVIAGRGLLSNDSVTNAHLANMAGNTIKGRLSTTGDPADLTGTQVTALLDTFSTSLKGLAPASGGGTANFLRADGSWAAPAGVGSNPTFTTVTANQFIVPAGGVISHYGGELYMHAGRMRVVDGLGATIALLGADAVAFPQIGTTASAANAYLDYGIGNTLFRSTSSSRYKTDVEAVKAKYLDNILNLRPVKYRSLADADDPSLSHFGFIAEEVAKVEPRLVHWIYPEDAYEEVSVEADAGGGGIVSRIEKKLKPGARRSVPDGVQYDRLTVLQHGLIRRQQAQIEAIEARLAAIEASAAAAAPKRP